MSTTVGFPVIFWLAPWEEQAIIGFHGNIPWKAIDD